MKRYSIHFFSFIVGAILISSCTDEDIIKKSTEEVIEGIPVTVELPFQTEDAQEITTKGAISTKDEYKVHDLYVFVFKKSSNSTWTKEYSHLFSYEELNNKSEKDDNGSRKTTGNVSFELTSGEKRIYAIANSDQSFMATDPTQLANVQSFDEFKNLTTKMEDGSIERQQGHLVMCGALEQANQKEEGYINIKPGTNQSSIKLSTLKLNRLDSRIEFKITSANDIQFIAKEWKVVNAPKVSYIYERPFTTKNNSHDAMNDENDYFDTKYTNFENITMGEGVENYKGGSFIFYLLENRKNALSPITDYQDRERQEKKDISGESYYKNNGKFLYADEYATYVVIKGSFRKNIGQANEQSAEVTYTVHLGYVGQNPDASDFRNERNCSYMYNMTIEGVDKIRLEVTSKGKQEEQPGAEGHIIEAQEFIFLDAHYETKRITFNKDKVSDNASFRVNTPYDIKGEYKYGATTNTAKDFKWVKFLKNDKWHKNTFMAYPLEGKGLLTIDQVIEKIMTEREIKNSKYFDKDGNVTFTVFIDEFYYDENPVNKATPCSWKEFVNVPNREMMILCNTEYSPDKQSSLTTSSFMISQRSIKTFYNPEDQNLQTAWGIETLNETGKVYTSINNSDGESGLSKTNGRYNMYKNTYGNGSYQAKNWNTYVNFSTNTPIDFRLPGMTDAQYACLQRNRDLDGDGEIDDNEIKWYLPAINQLTGIWMGKDGLPSESHLVKNGTNITSSNKEDYHFMSSNGIMFWGEEGSSTGHNDGNYFDKFDIRCVRNLGGFDKTKPENDDKRTKEPQDYVSYNSGTRTFTLDYMNERSIREDYIEKGEQTVVNELQKANRPYKKFQVAEKATGSLYSWNTTNNLSKSPCADYTEKDGKKNWRIPNQREISLIDAYANKVFSNDDYYPLNTEYLWSRTSSSLSYKSGYGYGITKSTVTLPEGGIGFVRCVRDIK